MEWLLNQVIISDEWRFRRSFWEPVPCVWKKSFDRYDTKYMTKSVKSLQSLMIWRCISATQFGNICFLKRSINDADYQDVLDHFLASYIMNNLGDSKFISQHDYFSSHSTKSRKEWFREKRIPVLNYPHRKLMENPQEEIKKIPHL